MRQFEILRKRTSVIATVALALFVASVSAETNAFAAAPTDDELRQDAVTEIITGFENLADNTGSYVIDGTGYKGEGKGWFHRNDIATYPTSIADALATAGYLNPSQLPHDPTHTNPNSHSTRDFLVYTCNDRIAVFTLTDTLTPTTDNQNWWTTNNCTTTAFDRNHTYFQLSKPAAAPDVQPLGQTGWTLGFEDNFDEIDAPAWERGWFPEDGLSTPVNDRDLACYDADHAVVDRGKLWLRLDTNDDNRCRLKDGSVADYAGALVNTRESFEYTYGYAEARIYMPSNGSSLYNWPAFWQTGSEWPEHGEIDIAEGLSTGQPCAVYHWAGPTGEHLQDKTCVDWAEPGGWHVFAIERTPDRITYFYDGVQVFEVTDGMTADPHYLILSYSSKDNNIVSTPARMRVDYVRVWTS